MFFKTAEQWSPLLPHILGSMGSQHAILNLESMLVMFLVLTVHSNDVHANTSKHAHRIKCTYFLYSALKAFFLHNNKRAHEGKLVRLDSTKDTISIDVTLLYLHFYGNWLLMVRQISGRKCGIDKCAVLFDDLRTKKTTRYGQRHCYKKVDPRVLWQCVSYAQYTFLCAFI